MAEFVTATIPELPENLSPGNQTVVEIHDPEVSPASGRVPLAALISQVTVTTTRAAMKALKGTPFRKLVILTQPEPGVGRSYTYVHGDSTLPNNFSIIAADDHLGTFFELLLS